MPDFNLYFKISVSILRGYFFKIKNCTKRINIVNQLRVYNRRALFYGKGRLYLGEKVSLGVDPSPFLKSSEIYLEARFENSEIHIGDRVCINNNAVIICGNSKIIIGDNTIIGPNFICYDNDFHKIGGKKIEYKPVIIGKNVFIGTNVTILKGVRIGDNAVIGAGNIITKDIPNNKIFLKKNKIMVDVK